jgi:hypothetical protein
MTSSDLEVADNGGPPAPAQPAPPAAAPVPALTGPLALMDPEARLNQLIRIAHTLAPIFNQQGMFEEFSDGRGGKRRHINVEGWTLLGLLLDVYAHVDPAEPRPWMVDEDTWAVKVMIRHISGLVLGGAIGVCGRTETDRYGKQPKRNHTDHQLQSMAHTRGVSKAFRVPFGVMAKLTGFDATPAEEMDGIGEDPERVRRAQDQAAERAERGSERGGRNGGGESRARARQRPGDSAQADAPAAAQAPARGQPARLVWASGRAPGWGDQADADSAHAELASLAGRLPGGHEMALDFLKGKGWLGLQGRAVSRLTPKRAEALRGKLAAELRRAGLVPPDDDDAEGEAQTSGEATEASAGVAEEAGLGKPQPAGPSKAGAAGWDPWANDPDADPGDRPAPGREPARHPGVDDPAVRETMTGLGWADDDAALNTALSRHEQLEDAIAALSDVGKEIVTVAAGGDDLFGRDHLIALEGIASGWPQLSGEAAMSVQSFISNADPRDGRLPRQIASMIAAHLEDQAKTARAKERGGETGGGETGETDGGETGGSGTGFDELPF